MDSDYLIIVDDDFSMSLESKHPQYPSVSSESGVPDIGGLTPQDSAPPVLNISNQESSRCRSCESQNGQQGTDMRLPLQAMAHPPSQTCSERSFPPLSRQVYQVPPEYLLQSNPLPMAAHPSFDLPRRAKQDSGISNIAPDPSPPVSFKYSLCFEYIVDHV